MWWEGGYKKTSKSIGVYAQQKKKKRKSQVINKFQQEVTGTPTKLVAGTIGFQNMGAELFGGATNPPP